MTQEEEAPREEQGARTRQQILGRNVAATSYRRLLEILQDKDAKIGPEQLARIMDIGTRIEGHALQELPAETTADGDLRRVLERIGFAEPE